MSSGGYVVVPLRPGSDGDATHTPAAGALTLVDPPTLYLEKTAQQWMQRRGEARPGVKYILERLPAGYTLWQRPRPSDAKVLDKYLFGHPNGRTFDSPNRYYPHFEHLMENAGNSIGCACTVCQGSGGVLPKTSTKPSGRAPTSSLATSSRPATPIFSKASSRRESPYFKGPKPSHLSTDSLEPAPLAQIKGRPKLISPGLDTTRVDEEGTPDVYRNLIDKLKRRGAIDEAIEEPLSLDWRGEQEINLKLRQDWKDNEQWLPRNGEVVLFVRHLPDNVDIVQDEATGIFELYNQHIEGFVGEPMWEAGLIGETPIKAASIDDDIDLNRGEESNVMYSGVRVEPLPSLHDSNKSMSKQCKRVPLRQIRPMVLWKEILYGLSVEDQHSTVRNALAIASTLSLVSRHRFRGTWPNASVYCHALYIGFELLAVGDTVRFLPNSKSGQVQCTDIMVINSIRLKWTNLDRASDNDYDEGHPYNSEIWVYGCAYTSDQTRSNKQWLSTKNIETPKAAKDYSDWYPLHHPSKELALPFSRILGRLYERRAMAFFLNSEPDEDMLGVDVGREGLVEARVFAREHDPRIPEQLNATWYWGDSRADALDLQTINGHETSKYDPDRDAKDQRKKIKLMERMTEPDAEAEAGPSSAAATANAAPRGRDLRAFLAPDLSSLPVRLNASRGNSVNGATSNSGGSVAPSQKRHRTIELSDDEDEEIRRATRIIDSGDDTTRTEGKARVMVVID